MIYQKENVIIQLRYKKKEIKRTILGKKKSVRNSVFDFLSVFRTVDVRTMEWSKKEKKCSMGIYVREQFSRFIPELAKDPT